MAERPVIAPFGDIDDPVAAFKQECTRNDCRRYRPRLKQIYQNSKLDRFDTFPRLAWNPIDGNTFARKNIVGKGTFGHVFRALSPSNTEVAVKHIFLEEEKDGFPITAIREIKILRSCNHPNVVKLLDVVSGKQVGKKGLQVFLVFEYVHHDLTGLIQNREITLELCHIKSFLKQLLEAMNYIHSNCRLLHRDIKCSNVLITNEGVLKLADFGLARQFDEGMRDPRYTNRVVTLWYRAPELLLGEYHYTTAVDMWSVGCIFAEMLMAEPLFQGNTEPNQLGQICRVCGTPTPQNWPNLERLIRLRKISFKNIHPRALKPFVIKKLAITEPFTDIGWKLLDKLLRLDPKSRCRASEGLKDGWFFEEPLPQPPDLSSHPSSHEFNFRMHRRQNARNHPQKKVIQNNHSSRFKPYS